MKHITLKNFDVDLIMNKLKMETKAEEYLGIRMDVKIEMEYYFKEIFFVKKEDTFY